MLLHGDEFGPATDENPSGTVLQCDDASRPVVRYGSEKIAAMATELDGATALTAQCCTVRSRTLISCLSGPGVGRGHSWHVTVGGQRSNVLGGNMTESIG